MAELFGVKRLAITKYSKNIYDSGEQEDKNWYVLFWDLPLNKAPSLGKRKLKR